MFLSDATYFKCVKQCVKPSISTPSCDMGIQMNSLAFKESALKSYALF